MNFASIKKEKPPDTDRKYANPIGNQEANNQEIPYRRIDSNQIRFSNYV
jgi:hypothetical protein